MNTKFAFPVLFVLMAGCSANSAYTSTAQMAPPANSAAMDLHTSMRKLWADHVGYTRNYIIAAVDGHASLQAVTDRLMRNQDDIGNAVAQYYGAAAGQKLTALLKDHIKIAGEVVVAAKNNDQAKLSDADHRWHENAEALATFLSGANPNWTKSALQNMLNQHLMLTTQEATMRLHSDWAGELATYDKVFEQAMMMADALSSGIMKQFPQHA
jgi:hypothetical protein